MVRIRRTSRNQSPGISISQSSIDYLKRRSSELGYDWELIHADLLAYQTDRKYDAIVIMGVIEHLPQTIGCWPSLYRC